jgi:hypothetical protein
MNTHSASKNTPDILNQEIPEATDDQTEDLFNVQALGREDGERANLDDALDDDNENPVSQTLIDAAENSGPEAIDEDQKLEGEAEQDKEK